MANCKLTGLNEAITRMTDLRKSIFSKSHIFDDVKRLTFELGNVLFTTASHPHDWVIVLQCYSSFWTPIED
jgi:hypothetical protein